MIFRTQLAQAKAFNQIDYSANLLLIGSCFSENIGAQFDYFKFKNTSNPFGILFHPKAIENLITNSINQKEYLEDDIFRLNERWHCHEAHSHLSSSSQNTLLNNLNRAIHQTNSSIQTASHIVITLGTAWVYREISSDIIVANCHKVPQKKFSKELLSVEEVTGSIDAIVTLIKSVNPTTQIIFTVSPVRHLKDGFVENSRSKAHLLSAIHEIVAPRNSTHYFPSYEIMMDDLREYRFYKDDMIHPNDTAISYIWEKFKATWVSDSALPIMEEISSIQKGLLHKPFNENSEQHQKFLNQIKSKKKSLKENYGIVF